MKVKEFHGTSIYLHIRKVMIVSLLMAAISVSAGQGSSVTINPNSISVAATVSDVSAIELRVAGPGGFRASQASQTGALDWYPSGLADGEYRYEVFVTAGQAPAEGAGDERRLYRENGRFKVENGLLTPFDETATPPLPAAEDQTGIESNPWFERLANSLVDFMVPTAAAADLITNPGRVYITDSMPAIYWNDTDVSGITWSTVADQSRYAINDIPNSHYALFIGASSVFSIQDDPSGYGLYNLDADFYGFYLDGNSGWSAFWADDNGDITLAGGSVFIDRSASNLGVGTITPAVDIHVVSTSPTILLDDSASGSGDIIMSNSVGEMSFYRLNGTYNGEIMTFENDLGGGRYPGVGIWQSDPSVPLHVGSHDDMSAGLLVQNTVAPTAAGDVRMFHLENTGDKIVRFAIQAGGGNAIWTFDNEPTYNGGAGINSGRFRIAKSGTGVAEFTVDGYGNGRFNGNSYAVNHVNTSSREAKTDFSVLDERDVLDKLMRLPVSGWRYKQEDRETRHVGPVAEDFRRVFGLGDGRHISTVDAEGVALAAIKAIKQEKDAEMAMLKAEKKAEMAALKAEKDAEVALLSERLRAVEALLMREQRVSAR